MVSSFKLRKAVRAYFGIIRAVELDERGGFGGDIVKTNLYSSLALDLGDKL